MMIATRLQERREDLHSLLLGMADDEKGKGVLQSLGFEGWETVDEEETELMIDLMDTLTV